MTQTEKNTIERYLPTDFATRIANELGVTADYVRMVKRGTRYNETIDACILKLALKNKAKMERRREHQLKNLGKLKTKYLKP